MNTITKLNSISSLTAQRNIMVEDFWQALLVQNNNRIHDSHHAPLYSLALEKMEQQMEKLDTHILAISHAT